MEYHGLILRNNIFGSWGPGNVFPWNYLWLPLGKALLILWGMHTQLIHCCSSGKESYLRSVDSIEISQINFWWGILRSYLKQQMESLHKPTLCQWLYKWTVTFREKLLFWSLQQSFPYMPIFSSSYLNDFAHTICLSKFFPFFKGQLKSNHMTPFCISIHFNLIGNDILSH